MDRVRAPSNHGNVYSGCTHLVIFAAMEFLVYFDRGVFAGLLTSVSAKFMLSNTEGGTLASLFMGGFMVGSPFYSVYAAMGKPQRIPKFMGSGLIIWIAASLICCFGSSFNWLVVGRTLAGVGESAFCSLAPPILDDAAPPGKKSAYIGLYFTMLYVGSSAGYVATSFFPTWDSGRYLFVLQSVLMLPLIWVCFFQAHRFHLRDASDAPAASRRLTAADAKALLCNPTYMMLLLGYAASTYTVGGVSIWGPAYVEKELGASKEEASFQFGMVTLAAGFAATGCGGFLLDRLGSGTPTRHERVLKAAKICAIVSFFSVPIAVGISWAMNLPTFLVVLFFVEFFIFIATAPCNIGLMESVPERLRALALAVTVLTIHALGDAISPVITGAIADAWSWRGAMLILGAWNVFQLIFWVAAWRAAYKRSLDPRSMSGVEFEQSDDVLMRGPTKGPPA